MTIPSVPSMYFLTLSEPIFRIHYLYTWAFVMDLSNNTVTRDGNLMIQTI